MARNKKNETAAIQFGPVLKVVLLCSLIGGSALGYVWQKNQIDRLGRQIGERERQLARLKSDNKLLTDQIALLHSPVILDRRVKDLKLGLGPAQPFQVVRLPDLPAAPAAEAPRPLAGRPLAGGTP
jgi:cell division protein FtsB